MYSYFESRGGKFPETIFFGLQYIIKRYLAGRVITEKKIQEAKKMMKAHFGRDLMNEDGWRYILEVSSLFLVTGLPLETQRALTDQNQSYTGRDRCSRAKCSVYSRKH